MFFQISKCVFLFFFSLKGLLRFPHFQMLTSSSLSSSSVYLTFPSSLRTASIKRGFPSKKKKKPTKIKKKKKSILLPERREFAARDHISKVKKKWNYRQWSTRKEKEIGLPKESLAPCPQMRCHWQGSQLPPLKGP